MHATTCRTDPSAAAQIDQLVNAERKARGLGALQTDPRLTAAAVQHACDMANRGFFDHRGSDGSTAKKRVSDAGFRACLTAENISFEWRSPAEVVRAWMTSAPHAANILRRGVQVSGTAFVPRQENRGPWVVQVFAQGC